jgi:HAD superfamily hydrolase (TIGR01450 family)
MKRDADWAFDAYEAVRDRLPAASTPGAAAAIPDIGAVAERFDAFLLDAYGVLNVGDTALPNAVARVRALQAAGKRVLVLTNGATYPADQSLAKYRGWGFDFTPEDIVSSREALSSALPGYPAGRWGVMARRSSRAEELPVDMTLLSDDAPTYAAVDGFILLGAGEWTDARQELLTASLRHRPRPVLVGNPDIVSPNERGLALEPGWFAHELARRTGARPEFFGKPFANVFDLARARLGPNVDRRRVAMVGDTLHTDILGGAAQGLATILVHQHGLFAGRDIAAYIARSGIGPDFVAAVT